MSFEDFLELFLIYFAKNRDLGAYFQSAAIDYFFSQIIEEIIKKMKY